MMQTLGEFLSPEAGQARRKWLDESLGQFIPPELRGWVGAGAELNPVTNVERAGTAARRMTAPGISGWDRMAAAGDMATNMGAVLAPVAVAGKAGVPATNAIVEALTAASPMRGAVDDFMVDEFGGLSLLPRGDYVGDHKAPSLLEGATLDNPADIWGDDIYRREAVQWFGTGDPSLDRQSVSVIQRMRNNPDAEVTIYRAVPADVGDDIYAGDWVTTSEKYARDHGESWLDGKYKILREKVKAKELATDGNSVHEWGWWPAQERFKGQPK